MGSIIKRKNRDKQRENQVPLKHDVSVILFGDRDVGKTTLTEFFMQQKN